MTRAARSALQCQPPLASTARRSGPRLSPRDPQALSEHRLCAKPSHLQARTSLCSASQSATPASAMLTDAGGKAQVTFKSP